MDKYIPKVGDTVFNEVYGKENLVLAIGKERVFLRTAKSDEVTAFFDDCKPIQTKADIENVKLVGIMQEINMGGGGFYLLAKQIQKDGFTIPKKIKRSDVSALISDWTDLPNVLTSEVCNLLGDLVEQDQ